MLNDKEILKNIIVDSSKVLKIINEFNSFKNRNKNSLLFKYLNSFQIGIFIIPYLPLTSILNLRLACKDINECLYYTPTMVSYSKLSKVSQKYKTKEKIELKPLNEVKTIEGLNDQLEELNKVNNYINSKEFNIENLTKIYRVEMDYLKYEEKHSQINLNKIKESLISVKEEYERTLDRDKSNLSKESINSFEDEKIYKLKTLSMEEIKTEIDLFKREKDNLSQQLIKLKKENNELNQKYIKIKGNIEKIKRFFQEEKELPFEIYEENCT